MKPPVRRSGPGKAGEAQRREETETFVFMLQSLIERCLILRMDREQCVRSMAKYAHVKPAVTLTVWNELERANPEFFREYFTERCTVMARRRANVNSNRIARAAHCAESMQRQPSQQQTVSEEKHAAF